MAYALNTNDIIEVSYRGTIFGQVVMNIFHYQYTGVPIANGGAAMATFLGNLAAAGEIRDKLLACCCPEVTFNEQRAQVVHPTRQVYTSQAIASPGTFGGVCTTPNASAVVLKSPDQAGRGRVGMVHILGVPAGSMANGAWQAGYLVPLDALGTEMEQLVTIAVANDTKPVIWSRVRPTTPSNVIGHRVNPFIRVEHRRTVGVGQ